MSDLTGEPIVRIRDLRKTYISKERPGILRGKQRAIEALKGISLEIARGEIFGLLGFPPGFPELAPSEPSLSSHG